MVSVTVYAVGQQVVRYYCRTAGIEVSVTVHAVGHQVVRYYCRTAGIVVSVTYFGNL